ncbi:uncharacterized protein [Diadema antillarum]|uniref:uncharacterized protein n=1 Tax=Diadema antillarum TaxID=105358 RepID=UPI003A8AA158
MFGGSSWATIYNGGDFGRREALVACRQLGFIAYDSDNVDVYDGGVYASGSTGVRLEWVYCDGRERRLSDCMYSLCEEKKCPGGGDIAVDCGSGGRVLSGATEPGRLSGFMLLTVVVFFFGHAYMRRREWGPTGRSLLPIPRYRRGRVPAPGLDDATTTSPSHEAPTGATENQVRDDRGTDAAGAGSSLSTSGSDALLRSSMVAPVVLQSFPATSPTVCTGPPPSYSDVSSHSYLQSPNCDPTQEMMPPPSYDDIIAK